MLTRGKLQRPLEQPRRRGQSTGSVATADGQPATVDGEPTLERAVAVLALVAELSRSIRDTGITKSAIGSALSARGLEPLHDGYCRALMSLDEAVTLDTAMFLSLRGPRAGDSQTLKQALARWPLAQRRPVPFQRLVSSWVAQRTPGIQQVLEALPREAGSEILGKIRLSALRLRGQSESRLQVGESLSLTDALADRFHSLISDLCGSVDVRYCPIRLYRDNLDSPAVSLALQRTRSAYPFQYSDELVRVNDLAHGLIIRVCRPTIGVRQSAGDEETWDGVFEYVRRSAAARSLP